MAQPRATAAELNAVTAATGSRFERDTAVDPLGEGRYEARIDPGWWIVAGPNGGYIAAIVLRAMTHAVDDRAREPRSFTLHYTARPVEGPAQIEVRIERRGRSLSTVSARLAQQDRTLCLALAAFSLPREAPSFLEATMPEVPAPEACERIGRRVEIHDRYDVRWALGSQPFTGGDRALSGAWIRLAEPRVADAPLVAAYADALPPAIFSRLSAGGMSGGVPTVELTVHFRESLPVPGAAADDFTLAVFRSKRLHDGFLDEEGEIWSRDGRLLAQSRQLGIAM